MGIDIVVRGPIHTVPYFLTQARGVNTCVDYHGDKISWEALVHLLVTVPNVADAVKEARANAKKETSKSDVDKMGKRIDLGKLMLVQEIDADTSWYDVSGKECGRKKQAVVDMWQLDEKRDKQAPRSDAMTRYAVWSDKCDDPKRLGCELRTTWNAVVSVKLVVRIGPRWKGDTDDLTFNASDYANGTDNTGTVAITDGYDGSGPPSPLRSRRAASLTFARGS